MALAQITMLADEAGEVQVRGRQVHAEFLLRFAAGAGIRRFALVRVELSAARAPEPEIRLLRAFQQQHFVALIKTIKKRGDAVWQFG